MKKNDKIEWSWKKAKQNGLKPSERISFSMVTLHDDTVLLFGGVCDQDDIDLEDEDETNSSFYNDLYKLDLSTFKWSQLTLRGKKDVKSKKSLKKNDSANDLEMEEDENEEDEKIVEDEDIKIDELKLDKQKEDSSVFTLTYSSPKVQTETADVTVTQKSPESQQLFMPHPRRSSYLQFYKGNLYLYGGKYEDKNVDYLPEADYCEIDEDGLIKEEEAEINLKTLIEIMLMVGDTATKSKKKRLRT